MLTRPTRDRPDFGQWAALRLVGLAGLVTAPIRYRLFWRFCRFVSHRLHGQSAVLGLGQDSQIAITLDDPYWLRLVARAYVYEPEIALVLYRFRQLPFTFVDCGANIGYWSILASSAEYGAHPTIAIEGSARTCKALAENCSLNGGRFRVIHAAVAAMSGRVAWFNTGDDPAGASLHNVKGPVALREEVRTIALDDLDINGTALIKLDVEGAEVEAIRGAQRLLGGDTLLCYEDHGADATCAPTQMVLGLGLSVFWVSPNGWIRPVDNLHAVRKIKARPSYGYNLFACRPRSVFADRLRSQSSDA